MGSEVGEGSTEEDEMMTSSLLSSAVCCGPARRVILLHQMIRVQSAMENKDAVQFCPCVSRGSFVERGRVRSIVFPAENLNGRTTW